MRSADRQWPRSVTRQLSFSSSLLWISGKSATSSKAPSGRSASSSSMLSGPACCRARSLAEAEVRRCLDLSGTRPRWAATSTPLHVEQPIRP
eukprot:5043563-Pyramimonas_sp.AAC.1